MDLFDASVKCGKMGGRLAIIHNQVDMRRYWFALQLNQTNADRHWLGKKCMVHCTMNSIYGFIKLLNDSIDVSFSNVINDLSTTILVSMGLCQR